MLGAAATAAVLGATLAQAAAVPGQGTWESTLQARELDGNPLNGPEAFYDTALDITWLRDANANGPMRWNEGNSAYAWATALVVGGIGGWRLPTMVDTGEPGCDYSFAGGSDCGFNVQTATSELSAASATINSIAWNMIVPLRSPSALKK